MSSKPRNENEKLLSGNKDANVDCIMKAMANVLFSILWLIILVFVGFWLAGIAAGFYIIVLPFTVCIEPLTGFTDFLLSVIQFPRYCAQAMMEGKGFN